MNKPGQDIKLGVTITRNGRLRAGLNAFVSVLELVGGAVLLAEVALVEVSTGLYTFLWTGTPTVPKKMMVFYRNGSRVETETIQTFQPRDGFTGAIGVVDGNRATGFAGGSRATGHVMEEFTTGEVNEETVTGEAHE